MVNAFTIDLEEWFCSHNLQSVVQPGDWDALPHRATDVTFRLLELLHKQGRLLVFYLHPWEMDAEMPRLPGLSRWAHFRHYTNLHTVEQKLSKLLEEFAFAPLGKVYEFALARTQNVA